uniref:FGGY carbohydrate kinase domain-containing protein n=1 Tax=Plectus sambesii TaxID=2011161 RepID=A0A914VWU4_9BILA
MNEKSKVVLGVDVGSTSVRALAVDALSGRMLASATESLEIHRPSPGWAEQSSDQIWTATGAAIRSALHSAAIDVESVVGIGFDATCSLVVLGPQDEPLAVSLESESKWNVIMWMDHRAGKEAEDINRTAHDCLKSVGGKISLEMEPPKLLWLKRNHRQTFDSATKFLDLADFLTYKATGVDIRSLCTVVCKWGYQASSNSQSWDCTYWNSIGLPEFANDVRRIGAQVRNPGERIASGLSPEAAQSLGLCAGTPVATGIIDAHAGTIGCLATKTSETTQSQIPLDQRLSLICGTSTCHMMLSETARYVPGIWGPYYGAVLPAMFLNEAGQSAAGSVLDMLLERKRAETGVTPAVSEVTAYLDRSEAERGALAVAETARNLHVWPDYHGNRSPFADPSMKGAIVGLTLDWTSDAYLPTIYLAHVFALAYGTKLIAETLEQNGHKAIEVVYACGGLAKNRHYMQVHADVLNVPIVVPNCDESVALGSAILASVAANIYPSLKEAMVALGQPGTTYYPRDELQTFHAWKYSKFRDLGNFIAHFK